MSRRKPFNDRAGYVASLRNPTSGGWCVIYKADEAELDSHGGNWITTCEVHGTLCNHTSLKLARASMKSPDFCEACESIRQHSAEDSKRAWERTTPPKEEPTTVTKTPNEQMHDALSVILLDRRISTWLRSNDPNTYQQAAAAVDAYRRSRILCLPSCPQHADPERSVMVVRCDCGREEYACAACLQNGRIDRCSVCALESPQGS